jgi:O-antigen/teichoic acid export membrane protein
MFDFTKWAMLGASALYFINWGDNLVLRYFVSMGDIGDYNLGYQVFKGIATLTYIVNAYFLPFVSQHIEDAAKMKSYLFNKRPRIFILGFAAIGLLFVLAPHLFSFFYGDIYRHSVVVLRILLVGSVLILYSSFYIPVFDALKKYKFVHIVNIAQVLLNLFLNLLLVPAIGMLGAAVATVFAYFCTIVVYEAYFRVKLKKLLKL